MPCGRTMVFGGDFLGQGGSASILAYGRPTLPHSHRRKNAPRVRPGAASARPLPHHGAVVHELQGRSLSGVRFRQTTWSDFGSVWGQRWGDRPCRPENSRFSNRKTMKKPKAHKSKPSRLCAHCGHPFAVDPRPGKRHHFCSRLACARASRRATQKKWRNGAGKGNPADGWIDIERVREWRKRHPQYWKRVRRSGRQQLAAFRLTRSLAAALKGLALQDTIDTRLALEIGIISRLSGAALQDTIAKEIRATILRGNAILRGQRISGAR